MAYLGNHTAVDGILKQPASSNLSSVTNLPASVGLVSQTAPGVFAIAPSDTAPQFDNSTHVATTQFVQNAGYHMVPGSGLGLSISAAIPVSFIGGWGEFSATGVVATLPPLANVLIGSTFTIVGGSVGGTLAANGTEHISTGGVPANTLTVPPGQTFTVTSNGAADSWYVTAGDVSQLGIGQTWQDVTVSRVLGTTYYNTTNRPIFASIGTIIGSAGAYVYILVNGTRGATGTAAYTTNVVTGCGCIIPPGGSYAYVLSSGAVSGTIISELR